MIVAPSIGDQDPTRRDRGGDPDTGGAPRERTVLVVDDDDAIVEALVAILESQRYRVLTASNGREALEKLEREEPDLVLLDLMMPVIDGTEVLKRLRAHPTLAETPAIVMSARSLPAEIAGVSRMRFFGKPFDVDRLLDAMRELLG